MQPEIDKGHSLAAEATSRVPMSCNCASTRNRFPDYLIFVTNVDLSTGAQSGGIDKLETYVRQLIGPNSVAHKKGLRIRAFKTWHADQIRTIIDAHQDIRCAFDGLLTIKGSGRWRRRERPVASALSLRLISTYSDHESPGGPLASGHVAGATSFPAAIPSR